MEQIKENNVFLNPYVIQMDKFADLLQRLSKKFLSLETYRGTLTKEEMDEMFLRVTEKVCENCKNKDVCLQDNKTKTYQMMYEILSAVEEYGAEINVELKRKLRQYCQCAPRFLRETLEHFENAKQILMLNNKIVQNRQGYAKQINGLAKVIQHTTRELDAGIFEDIYLEKKIKNRMKKKGIKVLSSVFYMAEDGKYEIHLTVKTEKGSCVLTKDFADLIGKCAGRKMKPKQGERPILGEEYCTVACVEEAKFYTLQGLAKIGKGCEKISGDTFLMSDLPGGKKGIALSDGMGAGENAFHESKMVVEMLEEILEAGFPAKLAIQMINTALVTGRDKLHFSTIDMCMFDLYNGKCEMVKAGAPATFLKRKGTVEEITSINLPIGVIDSIEVEVVEKQLENGDYIIMMTDGVMDALPAAEQESLIKKYIEEKEIQNPQEYAHYLLGKVLEASGEVPIDDMTILVVGIWKC